MIAMRLVNLCSGLCLLVACAKETPPHSVTEFLENRILLEATMVRCGENRNMSKYESECVNAREAANRIAAEEAKARRAELEAQSDRKRRALRRTQQAAAEARRRAAEARRRLEEAEYLGVYDETSAGDGGETATQDQPHNRPGSPDAEPSPVIREPTAADQAQATGEVEQDLSAIREELRRRQDSD